MYKRGFWNYEREGCSIIATIVLARLESRLIISIERLRLECQWLTWLSFCSSSLDYITKNITILRIVLSIKLGV